MRTCNAKWQRRISKSRRNREMLRGTPKPAEAPSWRHVGAEEIRQSKEESSVSWCVVYATIVHASRQFCVSRCRTRTCSSISLSEIQVNTWHYVGTPLRNGTFVPCYLCRLWQNPLFSFSQSVIISLICKRENKSVYWKATINQKNFILTLHLLSLKIYNVCVCVCVCVCARARARVVCVLCVCVCVCVVLTTWFIDFMFFLCIAWYCY